MLPHRRWPLMVADDRLSTAADNDDKVSCHPPPTGVERIHAGRPGRNEAAWMAAQQPV